MFVRPLQKIKLFIVSALIAVFIVDGRVVKIVYGDVSSADGFLVQTNIAFIIVSITLQNG